MQIPAILAAKELGLTVIGTDRNPEAAGFKHCDMAVTLDSKDVDGHVRFAVENPALYRLMFGPELAGEAMPDDTEVAGAGAKAVLEDAILRAAEARLLRFPADD